MRSRKHETREDTRKGQDQNQQDAVRYTYTIHVLPYPYFDETEDELAKSIQLFGINIHVYI